MADGEPPADRSFPAGHFHTAEEFQSEVEPVGLTVDTVVGVEGPAGAMLETLTEAEDSLVQAVLEIARAASAVPGIRDMSAHLLAVARMPE